MKLGRNLKNSNSPIVIGVTGHRYIDIEQSKRLKEKVCELFLAIKNKYSNTEIIVMSGLAIGADMICAEAAIESGFKLIASLPMEVPEFRKDFSSEDARRFDYFVSKADEVLSVSDSFSEEISRDTYYVKLGEYLTKNCNMLLALWDGDESHCLPGGTSDVVRMARRIVDEDGKKILNHDAAIPVLQLAVQKEDATKANQVEFFFYDVGENAEKIDLNKHLDFSKVADYLTE